MAEEGGTGKIELVPAILSLDDMLHVGHKIPSFRRDLRSSTMHGQKLDEIHFIGFLDQLEFNIAYLRSQGANRISEEYSMSVQLGEKQLGYERVNGSLSCVTDSSVIDEFNRINRLYARRVAASRKMTQGDAIAYAKTLVGL